MSVPAGLEASDPVVALDHVTVSYGQGTERQLVLDQTNFSVAQGDFVALVGPSGCGKSTILRLIGGLLKPTSGVVLVHGREIGARKVRVGMAFQNPTLLPWMTIRDNIMMPLKIVPPFRADFRTKRKGEYRDRVDTLLAQVGLAGLGDKHPWQLSGGMLQRASLCRAIIHDPELLMLDEPFGALDQFTREELWAIMQDLWMTRRPTVVLVTHDLKEAGYLATRICVMRAKPGRIVESREVGFGRPRNVETTFTPAFTSLTQDLRSAIVAAREPQAEAA
jgi:NitT/TauT family transport system ATP-binding protein